MYIPNGYGTVFPYMIVNGANDFVSFLESAFDATVEGRTELPNGRVANVRVSIGTSKFMVSDADGENMPPMPAAHCNIWWISKRLVEEPYDLR